MASSRFHTLNSRPAEWMTEDNDSLSSRTHSEGASSKIGIEQTVQLKRSIGLLHFTATVVSLTGHVAIFVSPSFINAQTGSVGASSLVWFIGGLINLGMALCYAELGMMFPTAAGHYGFTLRSLGPCVGFLVLWGQVVLVVGPVWAFTSHIAALFILRPMFTDCLMDVSEGAVTLLAAWILITMVSLNCVYVKYVTKVQTLLASIKIIAFLIIIGAGIYTLVAGKAERMDDLFEGTSSNVGQVALAVFYSSFSYGGWQIMAVLLEESKNPSRDPPRALYLSFGIIISLYVMINVAYSTLLTPKEMMGSSIPALLFMEKLYSPLMVVMSVILSLSSIGSLNALILGQSRMLFAGARNGHMPQLLGMLSTKYLTPWPSICATLVWAFVLLLTSGVRTIMEYISLFTTIVNILVVFALFYFRRTMPDVQRPYKVKTILPVLELLINTAILILVIYQETRRLTVGFAILFAGLPVYWFGVLWQDKPKFLTDFVDGLTVCAQKLFLLAKSHH